MKRFSTGNIVAIALGGLALAVAATGTAAAVVASTNVQIVDPTTPSRIAKVDPYGRLSTVGASSTTSFSSSVGANANSSYVATQLFAKPTSATLALTHIALGSYDTGSNFYVSLFRDTVPASATTCGGSVTSFTRLSAYPVTFGDAVRDDFAEPVSVAAIIGQKYCLELDVYNAGPAFGTLFYTINSFVSAGNFTANQAPAALTPQQHAAAMSRSGR